MHLPIGAEHELAGIVDVLHMCAYTVPNGGKEGEPTAIPAEMVDIAQEYREKLLDEVVQTDEALMEQYLGGEELDPHAVASALKLAITRGEVFPVACGVATKNLGTHALLDLIVEGVPSPAKKGAPIEIEGADTAAFVFKTVADPFAGRINLFRVLKGAVTADSTLVDARGHAKERMGTLLQLQGKGNTGVREFGEGDIGAVAKLKDVRTGDLLTDREIGVELPEIAFPEPVMSFAITPRVEGGGGEGRDGDPQARRGGPDAAPPPRPADRGGDPLGDEPDARRGRARAGEAAVRSRRRAASAARALPRDDPLRGAGARALQEADRRPRPVRRLPHRDRADRRRRRATSSSTRSSAA